MNKVVQSDGTVGKALEVLDTVAGFPHPVRFSTLEAQSPYPKATLYRLLQTLTHQRLLSYDPDRRTYSLGVRLVRLAHSAWQQASLAPIAAEALDTLSRDLGETVHLAQMDNGQVLYVDKRNARVPVEMFSNAGKVAPAYCTGIGKAMLAFEDEKTRETIIAKQSFHPFMVNTLANPEALRTELGVVRARGYAFDNEEHEAGIVCVALPILSRAGRVLGGLSVTSTLDRHSLEALASFAPRIEAVTRQIAEDADAWRFPEKPPAQEKRESPCPD